VDDGQKDVGVGRGDTRKRSKDGDDDGAGVEEEGTGCGVEDDRSLQVVGAPHSHTGCRKERQWSGGCGL
jgi:hypothetical protein